MRRVGLFVGVLGVALCLGVLVGTVHADKIILKSGREIEGEIIGETDEGVRVRLKYGEVTYPRADIAEIVKGGGAAAEYAEKRKALDAKDVDAVAALAKWCEQNGLGAEAERHWNDVLKLDTDHAAARKALGFIKKDGKWVDSEKAKATSKEEKAREKVKRREDLAAEGMKGVPWGDAKKKENQRYEFVCNSSDEVIEYYWDLLNATYDAYYGFFKDIAEPRKELSRVYVTRNWDDFFVLVGQEGIGGFYMPPPGTPSVPARTIVTYHGGFGATGDTVDVLLHEIVHQFERLVLPDIQGTPTWMIEGLAVFFENSRYVDGEVQIQEPGSKDLGFIPRERLYFLQQVIKQKQHAPPTKIIRVPKQMYGGWYYPHGWAMMYWLMNADNGKYRPLFYKLWENARDGGPSPEEVEKLYQEHTGMTMAEYDKVWEEFFLKMPLPPTGEVSKDRFVSDKMKIEVRKPSASWKWMLKDLSLEQQCVFEHTSLEKTKIEVIARRSDSTLKELEELGVDGLAKKSMDDFVADIESQLFGEELERKDFTIDGYPAVLVHYIETTGDEFDDAFGDEDDKEDEGTARFTVVIPTIERYYAIRGWCPAEKADQVRGDFDKVVASVRLLP